MLWGIYLENGQMDLVSFLEAESYEDAREKARAAGYGKEYRIEELDD